MGMASMASSAVSGTSSNFMSIGTADKRSKMAKDKAETQAKLALYNKKLAENQAIESRQQGKLAIQSASATKGQTRDAHKKVRESQRVVQAKSGVEESGTALLVQQDQLAEMKLAENAITYQGYLTNREKQIQAVHYDTQANMAQYQADVARAKGKFKAESIQFQKKLTIAKMFYDPGNATSFGEYDEPEQFEHLSSGAVESSIESISDYREANEDRYTPKQQKSGNVKSGSGGKTGDFGSSFQINSGAV